ncbi:MAG: 50S ribosomal protein L21 [candidate division NC10 bacterium]|nr:50S ribosomal protein L21 [candidate division NC10 bacterium]HLE82622.1 50S ribosomal protein L21 [Dehalococcoidia bacterium]
MYAVVETGGKQYRVAPGGVISVERLPGKVGDVVELPRVLLVGTGEKVTVGAPVVAGAKVRATIVGQVRGPKITVFKFKRRKKYRRKTGHRQGLTRLRVEDIAGGS